MQCLTWMENMACPWSVSHQGRKLKTDTNLVFSWIQVFFQLVILFGGAFSAPVSEVISTKVGETTYLVPCIKDQSHEFMSTTYMSGSGFSVLVGERDENDKGKPVMNTRRIYVNHDFQLVIQNTTLEDAGEYKCQVIPKNNSRYSCLFTVNVTNVRSESTVETSSVLSGTHREEAMAQSWSSTTAAAPKFTSSTATIILCLVIGFLVILLTNVGGVR